PELAAQFGVRSIPTLAIFKGGEVADISVGAKPKTALSNWISSAA
ncbi:thioredoxin domain-containing protein, partial [Rhizobium sp. PEPV16]